MNQNEINELEKIKEYAGRLLALPSTKKESYLIGDIGYEVVKLPAIDNFMTLLKVSTKTIKTLAPIAIPLIGALGDLQNINKDTDLTELLENKAIQEAIEKLSELNENDLAWLFQIASFFTARIGEKKSIDLDKVLEQNPNHYFLILFYFLKINVGALFLGKKQESKSKKEKKNGQLKIS